MAARNRLPKRLREGQRIFPVNRDKDIDLRSFVTRQAWIHTEQEHVLRLEAGIEVLEIAEGSYQQGRRVTRTTIASAILHGNQCATKGESAGPRTRPAIKAAVALI